MLEANDTQTMGRDIAGWQESGGSSVRAEHRVGVRLATRPRGELTAGIRVDLPVSGEGSTGKEIGEYRRKRGRNDETEADDDSDAVRQTKTLLKDTQSACTFIGQVDVFLGRQRIEAMCGFRTVSRR